MPHRPHFYDRAAFHTTVVVVIFSLLFVGFAASCSDILGGTNNNVREQHPEFLSITEAPMDVTREPRTEWLFPQDGGEKESQFMPESGSEANSESMANQESTHEATPEISKLWTLALMTFNIRLGVANDGDNAWDKRKSMVFDVIRQQGGDFVGMQEAWKFQIEDILQAVPTYQCVGRGRQTDPDTDEWSPICYRHARWTPASDEKGTFWLSETPETPGSKSWGSSLPRICTWARFVENSTGRSVYVFNTHYDHLGQTARVNSSILIATRMAQRNRKDTPVVLMGDFNAGESNQAILYLKGTPVNGSKTPIVLVDTFRVLFPDVQDVGTFNSWTGKKTGDKIDYIFVQLETAAGPRVTKAAIVYDNTNGRYPSDHFPVTARLEFPW